jgi:outer membrane protein
LKQLIIAVLCVGAAVSAARASETLAPTENRLTFQQALTRAMEVNNTVERSRTEISAAEANRKQLLSSVLPQVQATGSTIRNSTQVSFGSANDKQVILPLTDWNYRIVLSQPVFAGLREKRAYDQAKLGVENAREGALGTEDAVLLRVASNYLAAVDFDARREIEKQNIALAQKRLAQADAFFKAGEVTKVDVLRAETAIKSSQRLLAVTDQNREVAVSRLRADLNLDGPISVTRPEQPLPALPDEASLVARAEEQRPDVKQAQNNVQAAELEIKKQKGFWWPVVTFDAGYLNQKSPFPAAGYGYGALRFSVPIWQSGNVNARVAQARAREIQAQLLLKDAKVAAREDVRTAISALHQSETALQLAKDQLAAAEAEYQQAFELYRAQETTSLDLASSENSLAEARRAVAEETLNHDLAQLRVWYAAGALKEAVGLPADHVVSSQLSVVKTDNRLPTTDNGVTQR